MWLYISSLGPFLEVQNYFEFYFFFWRGAEKNKYVLGYDEIMNIFFDFWGSHFYTYKGFLLLRYRIGKCFGVAKFKIFLGMHDIPYIFDGEQ